MDRRIRAHFDGKVVVPDEPVQLTPGQPVEVHFSSDSQPTPSPEQRRAALDMLLSNPLAGPGIPDWALSREYIYDDD
jgi:hypothetical protein